MTNRPLRALIALIVALLSGVLAASAARADGAPGAPSASGAAGAIPPGSGWVRAGHFVPGFGAARVDLFPAADSIGSPASVVMSPGAAYGDVTSYQKVAPGDYTVQVRPQADAPSTAPMLSRSFTVTASTAHTIAVVGAPSSPRLAVLDDDLTPPAAGSARVRLLAASALGQDLTVQAVGGPTLASGAVLGQVTPYVTVPQGNWNLQITAGPTTGSQEVSLAGGNVYTAVALDSGAQPTIKVVADAAGAAAMPVGAAATGLGGLAADDAPPVGPAAVLVSVLLTLGVVGIAGMRARRRAVTPG